MKKMSRILLKKSFKNVLNKKAPNLELFFYTITMSCVEVEADPVTGSAPAGA